MAEGAVHEDGRRLHHRVFSDRQVELREGVRAADSAAPGQAVREHSHNPRGQQERPGAVQRGVC